MFLSSVFRVLQTVLFYYFSYIPSSCDRRLLPLFNSFAIFNLLASYFPRLRLCILPQSPSFVVPPTWEHFPQAIKSAYLPFFSSSAIFHADPLYRRARTLKTPTFSFLIAFYGRFAYSSYKYLLTYFLTYLVFLYWPFCIFYIVCFIFSERKSLRISGGLRRIHWKGIKQIESTSLRKKKERKERDKRKEGINSTNLESLRKKIRVHKSSVRWLITKEIIWKRKRK